MKNGFFASFINHMRTLHEVPVADRLNQRSAFDKLCTGMSSVPFTYEDFESARKQLIYKVNSRLTENEAI